MTNGSDRRSGNAAPHASQQPCGDEALSAYLPCSSSSSESIDLNADLGEGCPNDEPLLERISSASICCGAHAGDVASIRQTLRLATLRGVVVGAHPGYPDRAHFGRRERDVTSEEVESLILEQVESLGQQADALGSSVRFLKPHGALYNQAQRQEAVAEGVIAATQRLSLPLLGQPGTLLERLAASRGVRFIAEGFPDRRYRDDGLLVPREEPGAVLEDPAEIDAQVVRLVHERRVLTLCIHGDAPSAVASAERIRQVLARHQIAIRGFLS
ncbi:MAG: LamB/YcsF family protein [Planctomycetaceae bacterium]|nr:LamB/YcsF family protein [Planctomycetaceae bacterium]